MERGGPENRGIEVEAGRVSSTGTPAAPQAGAAPAPGAKYMIEGDPRGDAAVLLDEDEEVSGRW